MRPPQDGGIGMSVEQAHSDVSIIGGVRKPLQLH